MQAARSDPSCLASPVRVVVPSRSLRLHVAERATRHFGGALAGVAIQTLHATALELLARAGEPSPAGQALLPIVIRRLAREEPALRERLDDLVDGYDSVAGSVRDLLDAGFEPHHADAVGDFIAETVHTAIEREVAAAIARVANRAFEALARLELGHRSALLRTAAEVLADRRDDAATLLPARAVLVHGFADATGVAGDFIRELEQAHGAEVILDAPPRLGSGGDPDRELRFGQRFRHVVTDLARVEVADWPRADDAPPAEIESFEAPGLQAEARALAQRLRRRLDAGIRPESIAVVARDLSRYAPALRTHLGRLAVPFSGLSCRVPGGASHRRILAALALLREADRTPADRWLDARTRAGDGRPADLRVGLRTVGAARLGQVAGLAVHDRVRLPVRRGLVESDDDERAPYAERRELSKAALESAVRDAARLSARLEEMRGERPLAEQLASLRTLLIDDLGWAADDEPGRSALAELSALAGELPGELAISRDELLLLVTDRWDGLGSEPVGGRGGGVQILSVTEARARTFDELFLIGLNRDLFPRTVREDPLLPDAVRTRIRTLLLDLPVKREGVDEERFLFAQLLASSPRITISWRKAGDDGRPLAASTLLEGLRVARSGLPTEEVPSPLGPGALDPPGGPRPAFEMATLVGVHGDPASAAAVQRIAFRERAGLYARDPLWTAVGDPDAVAEARRAVATELDLGTRAHGELGPYYGLIGPPREAGDLRAADLYVTTLEGFAHCPWQHFVEKQLRIEPMPDPLEALPTVDALALGLAVHRTLERVVRETIGSDASEAEPRSVEWPDAERLEAWLRAAAEQVLTETGRPLPGLVEVLVRQARPRLERARALAFEPPPRVLAVERSGVVEVKDAAGQERSLHFRADRVDEGPVLIDYKSGRPISVAKKPATRIDHWRAGVVDGTRLQAIAYARSAPGGEGRYVHLRPDDPAECSVYMANAADDALGEAFRASVSTLLAALDAGAFVPRLLDKNGKSDRPECGYCRVSEVCLRGDSGALQRLRDWLDRPLPGRASDAERAGRALWARQAPDLGAVPDTRAGEAES